MAEAGERLRPGGHTHNITTEVTPTTSTINNKVQQQCEVIRKIHVKLPKEKAERAERAEQDRKSTRSAKWMF